MKIKLGDEVKLTFLDHTKTLDGTLGTPVECTVRGQVRHITKLYVSLVTWDVVGEEELEQTPNREGFAILRSCITKTKVFK
jgi:hypothetical protein